MTDFMMIFLSDFRLNARLVPRSVHPVLASRIEARVVRYLFVLQRLMRAALSDVNVYFNPRSLATDKHRLTQING